MNPTRTPSTESSSFFDEVEELQIDRFECKICGQTLYGDDTRSLPTERRGWVIFIPHFCCCGKCAWDCPHSHGTIGSICASNRIHHGASGTLLV
jgi:hypothetical protein